jgi:integrase
MTTNALAQRHLELVPAVNLSADQNPARIYLASLGQSSRRTVTHDLGVIAALLAGVNPAETTKAEQDVLIDAAPWLSVRAQEVTVVRAWLSNHYAAPTANKALSALRGTLKEARRLVRRAAQESQVSAGSTHSAMRIALASQAMQDALQDAIEAATKLPGEDTTTQAERGRALTFGELMALMAVCAADPTPAGVRDAAIIALMRVTGLRRAEVAGLDVTAYDRQAQRLTVTGKRNKTRVIPIEDPGTRGALADWLHLRGAEPGAMFARIDRVAGGSYAIARRPDNGQPAGLTDQAIYYILDERRQQAGVEPFTPHDLRRTFAGDLLDAGADLATAQKLMGHGNPATTAGYDRRTEQVKRKAVAALSVPYTRRYRNGNGKTEGRD